jgi:hypothetical protein
MDIFVLNSGSLYLINPYFFVELDTNQWQVKFIVSKNYSWKFESGKLIREERIDDDQIFFHLHLEELEVKTHPSQNIISLDGNSQLGMNDCLVIGRVTEVAKRGQILRLLREHLRTSIWKDLILSLLS